MSDKYTWNHPRQPYMLGHVNEHFIQDDLGYKTAYYGNVLTGSGPRGGESGKPWKGFDPTAKNRHWAIPGKLWEDSGFNDEGLTQHQKLDRLFDAGFIKIIEGQAWPVYERRVRTGEGPATGDIWAYQPYTEGTVFGTSHSVDYDVSWMKTRSKDRLGYPTQKPIGLLKRIILASSNPGDTVFDPFCGCGTTIYAAHETDRNWIGCDVAILAIKLIREILSERYHLVEGRHYDVKGIPVSEEQARMLFRSDPFQFEHWLVERIGGFPTKKTADKGVDGRLYFETREGLKAMVLSVKGGKLRPTDVRDLRGVLADEPETELAGFLSLEQPTKAMLEAAAAAGQYEYNGVRYDRMQFLTVHYILEEKREFHTPTKLGSKIATGQQSFAY